MALHYLTIGIKVQGNTWFRRQQVEQDIGFDTIEDLEAQAPEILDRVIRSLRAQLGDGEGAAE